MSIRTFGLLCRILLAALVVALMSSGTLAQQDTQQSTTKQGQPSSTGSGSTTGNQSATQTGSSTGSRMSAGERGPARVEVFAGYSWLDPGGRIGTTKLDSNRGGFTTSASYFFNRYAGAQLEYGMSIGGSFLKASEPCCKAVADINTVLFGPVVRFPTDNVTPWIHGLVGLHHLHPGDHGVAAGNSQNGVGIEVGGGLDLRTFLRNLNIRLFEADYQYAHESFFPLLPRTNLGSTKLSAGLVFLIGDIAPPVPATASCAASPSDVFAGEPVSVTVTPSNLDPKRTLTYSYNVSGGAAVEGKGATVNVKTDNLQPGSYTVSAHVSDGKKGTADCTANFNVKQIPPPTISCSANPTSVDLGGSSTITCQAASPVNRPVTVKQSASAGNVSPAEGPTTTLSASGVQPGPITVTSTVSDDKGQSASATTSITVNAPPPPPPAQPSPEVRQLETRLALHSIYFPTAQPTAKNPNGGLLASQRRTLGSMSSDFKRYLTFRPEAHLILEGHADQRGSAQFNQALSERRVDRVKRFLVEQGIPADHVETKAYGLHRNLNAEQVRQLVQEDPDLLAADRQRLLRNMRTIVLANNRRVDATLSTTGQQSARRYPFNTEDALNLISPKGQGAAKVPGKARPTPKKAAPGAKKSTR